MRPRMKDGNEVREKGEIKAMFIEKDVRGKIAAGVLK